MIDLDGGGKPHRAYLSKTADGSGPGVIVLQEWWGLVPHILDVADRFADAGFNALAPDLYGGETTTDPSDAETLMQALNISETEVILRSSVEKLSQEFGPKVGVIGFCMGGQLALFAAALNPSIAAAVDFYGIHPAVEPDFSSLHGAVLGIFAEHDSSASPERVAHMNDQLDSFDKEHEFVTYPGTQHAFFNDSRPKVYNAAAAKDAWDRTLKFFRVKLEG